MVAAVPIPITTTLVISFGNQTPGGGAHLSAEIDGRSDGYNNGITSFVFGDSPAYLVYSTPDVTYTQRTTQGSIAPIGQTQVPVEDIITFAEVRTATLSKPAAGSVTWTNLGGDSASFALQDTNVIADRPIFAVYKANYIATPQAFRLSGVPDVGGLPAISVLILIKGLVTV